MKKQADKRRSERVFQIGDQVFLKLQPYIQSSVAHRANHKLAFKFFGPFTVRLDAQSLTAGSGQFLASLGGVKGSSCPARPPLPCVFLDEFRPNVSMWLAGAPTPSEHQASSRSTLEEMDDQRQSLARWRI